MQTNPRTIKQVSFHVFRHTDIHASRCKKPNLWSVTVEIFQTDGPFILRRLLDYAN